MDLIFHNFNCNNCATVYMAKSIFMKKTGLLLLVIFLLNMSSHAQQKLNRAGMTYVISTKPNNIVFHDSIFKGSSEFKHLFFRTGDANLIGLYEKHQTNKIVGQLASFVGAFGIIYGVNQISGSNKGLGWTLIGGGFLSAAAGGYFTMASQKNLLMAITLFNQKYNQTTVGIGAGNQSIGIVYKF